MMFSKLSICFRNAYQGLGTLVKRKMSTERDVILERTGNAGVIILNRPKALNSLTLRMVRTIYPQLKAWDSDPSVKIVIMKGSGDRAFCAGGDVKGILQARKEGEMQLADDSFRESYQLVNLIGTLQTPCVAFIDGIVMGFGLGLAVNGAFRVCTEETVCAMPEMFIGFYPNMSSTYFLPRLPGKLGYFLACTGHRLQGHDVFKAGIATHFVDKKNLHHLECALMRLENPSLDDIDQTLLKFQQKCEIQCNKHLILNSVMRKINKVFDADTIESIVDALQKEGSDWSREQLKVLSKLPPTSMRVTLEAMKRGANMTLQDCLQMEYRITHKFIRTSDFHEGVTAVLIDKDKKPVWKPATLEEVTEAIVNTYFEYLPPEEELNL